jgi:putative hydrolase of the HAD superfamily
MSKITAALFDFGGVILSSPFDAFARYETDHQLPAGLIRSLNATNHHDNAWAKLERNEVTMGDFYDLFEAEASDAGHTVDARVIMSLLAGEVRPNMVEALRRCALHLKTACLTNNFVVGDLGDGPGAAQEGAAGAASDLAALAAGRSAAISAVMGHFDVVIESSKVGVRKPDPRFYRIACEQLGIDPQEAVFLDDLGINLKPAREMGMTTIKVTDPEAAITELEEVVGFALR